MFVALEELSTHVDEVECLLELALLGQQLQVKFHEVLIHLEVGFFHQLEEKEIGDVEDLGLEFQVQANQVHRLDSPHGVVFFVVNLVQVQRLVLLLEQFSLTHV